MHRSPLTQSQSMADRQCAAVLPAVHRRWSAAASNQRSASALGADEPGRALELDSSRVVCSGCRKRSRQSGKWSLLTDNYDMPSQPGSWSQLKMLDANNQASYPQPGRGALRSQWLQQNGQPRQHIHKALETWAPARRRKVLLAHSSASQHGCSVPAAAGALHHAHPLAHTPLARAGAPWERAGQPG